MQTFPTESIHDEALMHTPPPPSAGHDVRKLRQEAGKWFKSLREARGLTQRELAEKVGVGYYTVISQLEVGRGRVRPEGYERWAHALGVDPREFVRQLLRFNDPEAYRLLFEKTQ